MMALNAGSIIASLDLDTGKFSSKLADAQKQADGFSGKLKGYGQAAQELGKGLTLGVTAPIVGIAAAAGKLAIDFESAFAGVRKTTDATEAEFAVLEKGIRDMSKEIPASATAIAGVAEAAGQLGIELPNMLDFTRVMVDLGESTNMSAEEAATALARLANITGMSQTDFDRLGSTIVDLGNNLATTEGEIVAMGLRLAGAGSQIGLTEAQTMSFAGALSSVGIEAEAGGSAFSKVMIDMQLAVETGSERLDEFANVAGMTASEFKQAFQEDAAGAIISFIEGLGTMDERGQSAIKTLDDMEITEVRMRDALLRAAGASDVFTDSLEIGNNAWEENTALTNEAAQRYETTASQIEIAKNHFKDAGITIGETLLPHIVKLAEGAKNVAEWFSNLNPETQDMIVKAAGLAAAIGPVLSVGGKLASGASTMIGLFSKLSGGTGVATKAIGTLASSGAGGGALGVLAGKLGAATVAAAPVALGVGAVAAAGYGLHQVLKKDVIPEVDLFADKVEQTADITLSSGERIGSAVMTTTTSISEATQEAVGAYLELDDTVRATTDGMYIHSTRVTQDMKDEISGLYGEMTDEIIAATDKRKEEELANLQSMFDESKSMTTEEQNEILSKVEDHYNQKKVVAETYEEEINAIYQRAADENRAITEEEHSQITRLREGMKEQAIQVLSEQEVEANIILERLKEHSTRVSAEQATEMIAELNRGRDEAIAAANESYDGQLEAIIRLRDESKAISAEQADKMIEEAKRQRDGIIESAEDTRNEAVDKIFGMNADLIKNVDASSGEIISGWQRLFGTWDKWKPSNKSATFSVRTQHTQARIMTGNGGTSISAYARGTDFAPGGMAWVGEEGPELVELPRGSKVHTTRESKAMATQTIEHSGTIRVEGVNNEGELVSVVEHHISKKIGDDNRRIPDAPSIMPI